MIFRRFSGLNSTVRTRLTSLRWRPSRWSFTTFSKQPGQTVQLDRYRFFGNPGSKESRERTAEQTIGTANSRNIVKDKVLVTLKEYTGPADPGDPTSPSTFKIARETLITAQRLLLDTGNLTTFHQSIGSSDSAGRLSSVARSGVHQRTPESCL